MLTEEKVVTSLTKVKDPELGLDMVALGLIYKVTITEEKVHILMTLTFPGCPWGPELVAKVKAQVAKLVDNQTVEVDVTFDPPWDLSMMNSDSKMYLGMK